MTTVVSTLTSSSFWLVFALAGAVPYAMYLVAYVFESRTPGWGPGKVPVWRGQSRAFLPGDFGLAWTVAVCWQFRDDVTSSHFRSPWFWLGSFAGAVVLFVVVRRRMYTPEDYTANQWASPTKRWHDFVMYVGFTTVAAGICIPVLLSTSWPMRMMALSGLILWVAGVVYDICNDETPNQYQHPDSYQPIWRSSR